MSLDLFSHAPITWGAVRRLYGSAAEVAGVKSWYHPEKGWRDYPATTAMATKPEDQVQALAGAGATHVQLYVDIPNPAAGEGYYDTRTPDFRVSDLLSSCRDPSALRSEPTTEAAEPPAVIL